ncbi:dienelactone hydrolase [Herbaspirillum sp. Sphag1AN]|uniref:alpha/beta hydrolase family protein n=1 Tax=unclassified Herbaspirillum TaxID=2624150 RepID=UPI00161CB876|nr:MULTISPECIES: alpha/beta fold hydrolase [unclassified Herbaspirillum]MBB3212735.1 dienelactone hydrolase [Herbaspirillum sp. Sphag1AN]MBB3245932.1 dienelactone hydrolase [Herbaspirillum sp. Sphag64]
MKKNSFLLYALCVLSAGLFFSNAAVAEITEQQINIPVQLKEGSPTILNLVGTLYRPEGNGPFPVLLINHGTPRNGNDRISTTDVYQEQAHLFAAMGFVVINPIRRGYGKSDGPGNDGYHTCDDPYYFEAGLGSARDISAVIDYVKTQPYVDPNRIVLLGKSTGGVAVLATASLNKPGVIGVINFAGGRGSQTASFVCNEDRLVESFSRYASTTHVPMLWLYAKNDRFFGPALAKRLLNAYLDQHVDVRFVQLPWYGSDGHAFFDAIKNAPEWMKDVGPFLNSIGANPAPLSSGAGTDVKQ